ncbi:30S ribosomal protein S1 [Clostridium carboxidivorans P7]|uniref:RNA binding S1 domain protein n=1 Tax=Clostridium carboxidivorans P7 TaxID=536227 RepID=C6PXA3_9CLOT|nr:30S ribosomal protein S1 [Clostridium carboxidivorans]AKN32090.1 30S ribosomal protein S1 [Clostridium carboxidivorans P7]EET86159.1 RNA binding S1 domain protein [Clostridium carboxidivorans P7]EFG88975.1 30S ribosomal protein S1 [Clostridium carboxidivorans P7]
MTEEIKDTNSMKEFMEDIESSMKSIRRGEVVKGKIISVTENHAIVNIGYMSDGILSKSEVVENEEDNLSDILKENEEIYVYVLDMNDGEGNVLLSKKAADKIKAWDELKKAFEEKSDVETTVKEVVKGGVVTYINGIRAFIPASQLSLSYVEDLKSFIGKTLTVKVIEFDKDKEKVVLSRKVIEKAEAEEKKQHLLNSIKPGEKRSGVVSRLAKFGAFVDLGGVDGLIHVSELSWKRVNNPADVVSVGDKVEVYILSVDKENNKIALALKDVNENPWESVGNKFKIGDVVEGEVLKLASFGAFVEIQPGVEGLVHISEISEERIAKPSDVLNLGDKVRVKILDIDNKENRISLSIKDAVEKPKEDLDKFNDNESAGTSLADLLKDFKF